MSMDIHVYTDQFICMNIHVYDRYALCSDREEYLHTTITDTGHQNRIADPHIKAHAVEKKEFICQ